MTGRYVRLAKGELVCQRHDLQGVIAHLHDLARHLEHLIPDEDFMDKLSRSRDFAGGFAEREKKRKAGREWNVSTNASMSILAAP